MGHKGAELRVLIVEDDPTFLSFWRRFLPQLGLSDCTFCSDSKGAKAELKKGKFDLLISDIILPGTDGYKLARYAAKQNPDCQTILTTAYNSDLSRFSLKGLKFHLLHKPYTNLGDIKKLVLNLLHGAPHYEDFDDDSFSENEDYPQVMEWKL